MRATIWASSGKKQLGIRVGVANRDKYFDIKWNHVEVEMDGVLNRFDITNGFWNKCPEFRDHGQPLIRDWIQRHGLFDWAPGHPPVLELVPLGNNQFRLNS